MKSHVVQPAPIAIGGTVSWKIILYYGDCVLFALIQQLLLGSISEVLVEISGVSAF